MEFLPKPYWFCAAFTASFLSSHWTVPTSFIQAVASMTVSPVTAVAATGVPGPKRPPPQEREKDWAVAKPLTLTFEAGR